MEGPQVDKLAGGDYNTLNEKVSHDMFPKLSCASLKAFSKDSLMVCPSSKSSLGRVSAEQPARPSRTRLPCWKSSSCFSIENHNPSAKNALRGPIHSMSHIMSEQDLITEWEGMSATLSKLFPLKDVKEKSSQELHSDSLSRQEKENLCEKNEEKGWEGETPGPGQDGSRPSSSMKLIAEKVPASREMSEISIKSTSDMLNPEEFRSEEEMAIIAEIKRIQEILNNSLVNVDSVTKANNIMKRGQNSFILNQPENENSFNKPGRNSSKDPQQKPRVLWALTKVSIFPDDSRTYEVMKLTDKKPTGMPEKLDSVFVLVNPK